MVRLKLHCHLVLTRASNHRLYDPVVVPTLFVAMLIVATIVAAESF